MNKENQEKRKQLKHRRQKYAAGELGPIEANIDEGLKSLAVDWAEKVVNSIESTLHDPTTAKELDLETLRIYRELEAWSWFNLMPIDVNEDSPDKRGSNAEIYIHMLAMDKYHQLKWNKDHPTPHKPSKWEIVTGAKKK